VKRKHHELLAWQEAIKLVKATYLLTQPFPREEQFGLISQMRRAAVSVPANIAEGAARSTAKEFTHFLSMARGSLSELETYLVIARELGYVSDPDEFDKSMERVFRLLSGLIASTKR
jgi:four helix bundle protein